MEDEKDYYQLLGVKRDASKEEITRAYRELARIYHPDSNYYSDIVNDSANGKDIELFKKITEAYKTLIDDEKRKAYDKTLLSERIPRW